MFFAGNHPDPVVSPVQKPWDFMRLRESHRFGTLIGTLSSCESRDIHTQVSIGLRIARLVGQSRSFRVRFVHIS